MRVAVFGTGGVGGYFGTRLAQADADVTFIARGEHLEAIREHGLRVVSGAGDVEIAPAQATDDPKEVGPVDVVLLGVKSWQVSQAAEAMRPLIGPQTFVVPLQNGVDAADRLVETLGEEHVVGGTCALISWIEAPGLIHHPRTGSRPVFGELRGGTSARTKQLQELFEPTIGTTVTVSPDIHTAIWRKLVLNTPLSGIGAITRTPLGVVRDLPESYQLLVRAVEEVSDVALAQAANPSDNVVSETLEHYASLPAHTTVSMQRDIMDGRPSELHDQIGAVVRRGEESGVKTPVHSFIYHSLLPAELRARERALYDKLASA